MHKYCITKHFKFEAAHRLNLNYTSPCKSFHGHSYKVTVKIFTSDLDEHGMVMDFSNLKFFQEWLDLNFDHSLILTPDDPLKDNTDVLGCTKVCPFIANNSTSENMAKYFAEYLIDQIRPTGLLRSLVDRIIELHICVSETQNNIAEYIEVF